MMLDKLKQRVCDANLKLAESGLVILTWGNVSGFDKKSGKMVIKPSGLSYQDMSPEDMVVLDLDGRAAEGSRRPSSDSPTHLALYRAFEDIGGIAHTHSMNAAIFAQALMEIPCLGTTHADHFNGPVPVTRFLTEKEVREDYEGRTGIVIVERFEHLNPLEIPAVLVAGHGPFTWGRTPEEAVENSLVLEQVAGMAKGAMDLNPQIARIPDFILDKHYQRKHGDGAYYGQGKKESS
jgi:L-ribulose-5-phosphate 4-epimerase